MFWRKGDGISNSHSTVRSAGGGVGVKVKVGQRTGTNQPRTPLRA